MGYCIAQTDSSFFIPKELFGPALQAILSIMTEETSEEAQQIRNFSWVNTKRVLDSKTLTDALEEWRWSPTLDEDDNIIDIQFMGEKEGDDYTLFSAIAPYVRENSTISMAGEDHYRWRWFFDGQTVYEQKGMITYI